METWGNKVKIALSRLGKTDNYLYTKPEQDWTQEDKALVISLLRKSKVAENTQMEDLQKIKEFFSQPIPGEDAIDTISMDVPLFLRMLEYAREDAQEDVDLHDVTQRATELSKMKPFLSMEDYNEIVAATQEINEDAFEDTWTLNREKAQSFIEKYPNDVNIGFVTKYLTIDDIVDANKYWNTYNLKNIISGVESLKEIVRATL